MKVSYVTTYDASDVHKWSGTGYYMAQMLEQQGMELHYLGMLKTQPSLSLYLRHKWLQLFSNQTLDLQRAPSVAQKFAHQVQQRLPLDTDMVFSPGSIPIAYLDTPIPKVFYTDATFAGMLGFYQKFSQLSPQAIRHGHALEKTALETASLAIYSSDWAAQTAIDHYGAHPKKVKVVPFGSNFHSHMSYREIQEIITQRSASHCHLLFIGVDWERKGGEKALEIARLLNQSGQRTSLHIVGIKKFPYTPLPDFVIDYGFLSKKNLQDKELIKKLYAQSHFLLLPTQAEAYGLVFCEASSFGLPSITSNVGGIPTVIKDEVNGKTFSSEDHASRYVHYILAVFQQKNRYRELCLSSYNEFASRLNWQAAGQSVKKLLKQL